MSRTAVGPERAEWTIESVVSGGGVRSVYQPIIDLRTSQPLGFEALARGPRGSSFESPAELFPAAAASGLRNELERSCLRAAFDGASEERLPSGLALFVNLEPGLLDEGEIDELLDLSRLAASRNPIFVELTERELTKNPMQLLRSVNRMRESGLRIALDDVGADPASLALLPFVDPEVIKLDLGLIHDHPRGEVAEIVHAVNAQAERTGAIVLAEGIEHEHHLERATAIGATLGQGWYFGRPAPLAEQVVSRTATASFKRRGVLFERTPFEVVASERETRFADKRLLLALSLELEAHAEIRGRSTVLLSTFQEASFFTTRVSERYERMASNLSFVGALAWGARPARSDGVRWAQLEAEDPLVDEWNVAVIGPHFAAAFVATDLGDTGVDMDRRFEFAITYDRALAVRAARSMMRRLAN